MSFARSLFAAWLALVLGAGPGTPLFAQEAAQQPGTPAVKTAPGAAQQPGTPAAKTTPGATPLSLQLSTHNFSRAPRAFPNLINPYRPIKLEPPNLENSLRLEQLIHDGKLEISLRETIELALENNLDIVVQRYNPWIADTDILRTLGGGTGRGLSGTGTATSLGSIPPLNFDPTLTSTIAYDDRTTPVNNPFTAGTGTAALTSLKTHTAQYNMQYSQGFWTGTGLGVSWNNTRSSTSSPAALFNPSVQSSLFVSIQQELLNGFGLLPNTRNIRIAKNNRKIADLQFEQQAITTITGTINTYWELVYARENVKVQERAVGVAEKLYSDNKKQVEIGTMAPIDVVRAESEVATNRQNLIVAQTVLLQQQQALKNAISKNPLDAKLIDVEIIPTDLPAKPEQIEAPTFAEALREAFANRPDLRQQDYNLKNADISVRATRNALLPVASVSAQYGTVGLAGNSALLGTPSVVAGTPVVDASGLPVTVLDASNAPIPIYLPQSVPNVTGLAKDGLGGAMSQVFHNQFPDYAVQFSLTIPLRNRQAQADNQRALLAQRQLEAQVQQLKNAALLDVRNAYIALEQDRARVEAAVKARVLQEQTFDAEQKKYQLGASTVFLVIQTQRDLTTAQGNELRALVDLVKAKADYERALGRTLDVNRVTLADAKSGEVERETLIPGTLHGEVVGTSKGN
ncbi:MAG: TolC family protein [Acidobacteriia bacterium]|nr:TolC family protein [Terriglobia bacterium]